MSEDIDKALQSFPDDAQDRREEHHKVTVTVDSHKKKVPPGSYVVSAFKEAVHVDLAKELDQVVDGVLKPLDDTAMIVIAGGETFISHERTGGAS
jgi:hypothetical protein